MVDPKGCQQEHLTSEVQEAQSADKTHGPYLKKSPDGKWSFSEFPPLITNVKKQEPNVEMSIAFDEKNLAVGKARYTNATHLNKNLAIHPGGLGNTGEPMVHGNVEIHIKVDGKEVPMTARRVRYWDVTPMGGATVANQGEWQVDYKKGAWSAPPTRETPRAWDGPGSEDAPAMVPSVAPQKSTGDLHEFLAGNPKYGGFYYQMVTLYDPDLTARVLVYNTRVLTANEFRDAIKRIESNADTHSFLFEGIPIADRKSSDTGVMTDIPDRVKSRKKP